MEDRSSACADEVEREHVVAAPAVGGSARSTRSKPSTALGAGNLACRNSLARFDRSRDSSSREHPRARGGWPGVAVSRNHDIVSADMNSDLAREGELPALRLRDPAGTGRTPFQQPEARS